MNNLTKSYKSMGLILGSGSTKPQYPYDMWYGVEKDITNNDYKLTRIGNLDLHRSCPIQRKLRRFVENEDGSVKYYLGQNDSRIKESGANAIIDSTDGNVMLEKPEYYLRVEWEGTKWARAYSEYPLPGFIKMERKTCSPWGATLDAESNTAVSGSWITWNGNDVARDENGIVIMRDNAIRYRGGDGSSEASKDGTYNSQLGMPRTAITKATARKACKNGTHIGFWRIYNEIAWLQRLEYASMNCQDAYNPTLTADGFRQGGLGNGCSANGYKWNKWGNYRPFVPCGVTAVLGNNTGKVQYIVKNWDGVDWTVQVTSYRGLETPYEYLWWLADDVLIYSEQDGVTTAYVCDDPAKFTSHSDSSKSVPDGYIAISNLPRKDGYILYCNHSIKGYTFPAEVGGAPNKGDCDYFYTAADNDTPSWGWFGALLAGSATAGSGAGFGCLFTGSRSSYSYADTGFRLCRF